MPVPHSQPIIEVQGIETRFGTQYVHRGVSFAVHPGQVVALIGSSGTGKSVLLREIIGLLKPTAGKAFLFGEDVWEASESELAALRRRFGVLFQNGALFSALTVGENIAAPLREQTDLNEALIRSIVQLRLGLVGLKPEVTQKMPSELSGGMRKRVALARALALEPELLFLDEPTSGLDPISARAFDTLVRTLSDSLGLTVFMVTHDLDSIESIAEHLIVLDKGKVLAEGTVAEVARVDHEWIRDYFSSRAAG
ncbi:MAG: ABC transporter ATP-binding protein [Bdellovibrionales bacterium]|nr:ABC transporter ATP-binding protein [Bdellovibrionales bacterium]